ncbi:MAG: pilus assembly protein PilM [Oscillospiraceae bacterium]|nr:pilus assembly protein PilM [Oscillospiraceae bacterium]
MLSFDITDRNIRIIKGSESNGKVRINSAATLNLEEEVIVNGHVRDVPRLATLINQVLRTNKMPDKEAIVSISSNMTIFKELHIQKTEKQQDFMKMVRAEMAAALGIDDSYSVSYIVVGDSEQTQGGVKVLATACPYEVVDCYKRVFNMLQISLRSVMIGCNCITKVLLADTKVKSKMPLLAVQIDNNFISLNLYENGQLSFSRFASISAEDYDDSEDYVFEAVNENIFRMLQFQKSKSGSEPIENVVFYGDTHEYVRLTNELEKMGIRTSIINVPPQVHGYENLEFSSYANAIGAMFKRNKDTERINLLETDTVNNNKIKSDSSYFALLGVCAAVSLVICAGTWFFLKMKDDKAKDDIQLINEKSASAYAKSLDAQIDKLTQTQDAVTTYHDGVLDAYQAYVSRPKPTKAQYEEIEKTIKDTVKSVLKIDNDDDLKEALEITTLNYSDGIYIISLESNVEPDLPVPTLPTELIKALRALPDVSNIQYNGYSVVQKNQEEENNNNNNNNNNPGEGEEGAAANNNNNNNKKNANDKQQRIQLSLNVSMKGGTVNWEALGMKQDEEAAEQ